MVQISKREFEYIQKNTRQKVYFTIANKFANARKKTRYVALDDSVKNVLVQYQKELEQPKSKLKQHIIERYGWFDEIDSNGRKHTVFVNQKK